MNRQHGKRGWPTALVILLAMLFSGCQLTLSSTSPSVTPEKVTSPDRIPVETSQLQARIEAARENGQRAALVAALTRLAQLYAMGQEGDLSLALPLAEEASELVKQALEEGAEREPDEHFPWLADEEIRTLLKEQLQGDETWLKARKRAFYHNRNRWLAMLLEQLHAMREERRVLSARWETLKTRKFRRRLAQTPGAEEVNETLTHPSEVPLPVDPLPQGPEQQAVSPVGYVESSSAVPMAERAPAAPRVSVRAKELPARHGERVDSGERLRKKIITITDRSRHKRPNVIRKKSRKKIIKQPKAKPKRLAKKGPKQTRSSTKVPAPKRKSALEGVSLGKDGVPRFKEMRDFRKRKRAFFEYLAPIVQDENRRLLKQRKKLYTLRRQMRKGVESSPEDLRWLGAMAQRYGVTSPKKSKRDRLRFFREMFKRVHRIPVSLALAQAAMESGWGTSRFAVQGYNYFGHWCMTKGCGMVPTGRDNGKTHEVTRFASVRDSVRSYLVNLNSGRAYRKLRNIRARLVAQKKRISGYALAGGLSAYSSQGRVYVRRIRRVIRDNGLAGYRIP
ncbi:MAG: glucosaminidase domain-containing protein [Magnetococcales bacterium]|nr:glucosaminidase domain-containing protein [Magnetococcales bacterium]